MSELIERKIPTHVAIILDGNGRWAKKRGLPRNMGHVQGAKNVETVCAAAWDMGIKYVTMYAFSTENWKRPQDEVDALMKLLHNYMKTCLKTAKKNNMRVRVIGDITRLDEATQTRISELEAATKEYTGLNFQIALNYGSRDEIVRAVKKIVERANVCEITANDVDEAMITRFLDTADIPDPDLLIRPSGEQRISNYLLWQIAYAELYFTDVLWPDFGKKELELAIEAYNGRDRRFGLVTEQET